LDCVIYKYMANAYKDFVKEGEEEVVMKKGFVDFVYDPEPKPLEEVKPIIEKKPEVKKGK
jgi:hypothetical protein